MAHRDEQADRLEPTDAEVRPAASSTGPGGLPTHLPLGRQVWTLARWPLAEQLLGFLVWFVDTTLAGHLTAEAAASTNAIGVASYVMWLMGLLQGAVGIAATALIARRIGARNHRAADEALGQAILTALSWGMVIGGVFFLIAPLFGMLGNLEGRSLELCTMYVRMLAITAPCMATLFIGGACLRGAGDFRSPFGVMVVVNLVNVGLSVLLVNGPAPIGGRGLAGIALGTMVAWTVGALLMLARLARGNGRIRLTLPRMKPNPAMLGRLVRIAVPALADHGGMWAGNWLIIMIVGILGVTNAQGAHIICLRIEGFSFLPGFAFSQAAATMVGQYLGAGDARMARRSAWACWGLCAVLMTTMGAAFMILPKTLVGLMTNEPSFLKTAPDLLWMAGWGQIGFATSMVLAGAMRGAGDTRTTMLLNYTSTYLIRLPLVWGISMTLGYGLVGLWFALSAELTIRGAVFLARFLHGGWARVRV